MELLMVADEGPGGNIYDRPQTPRFATSDMKAGGGDIEVNLAVFMTCCDLLERRIRVKETNDEYLDDRKDGNEEQPGIFYFQ